MSVKKAVPKTRCCHHLALLFAKKAKEKGIQVMKVFGISFCEYPASVRNLLVQHYTQSRKVMMIKTDRMCFVLPM